MGSIITKERRSLTVLGNAFTSSVKLMVHSVQEASDGPCECIRSCLIPGIAHIFHGKEISSSLLLLLLFVYFVLQLSLDSGRAWDG